MFVTTIQFQITDATINLINHEEINENLNLPFQGCSCTSVMNSVLGARWNLQDLPQTADSYSVGQAYYQWEDRKIYTDCLPSTMLSPSNMVTLT
jgi:hypothetical protein